MFSLANVLGKSQKYKVCELQAVISCSECQHLTGAIDVTSAQLNSELGPTSGSCVPVWLGQFALRSCPRDEFVDSDSTCFPVRIHQHCSNVGGEEKPKKS